MVGVYAGVVRGCLLALVLMGVSGCSMGFNREWRSAGAEGSAGAGGMVGRWEGSWVSEVNGHRGRLRCVVKPGSGDGEFTAYYHATFWKLFQASYRIPVSAKATNGVWTFHGGRDLGWLYGGHFDYQGTVVSNRFDASYKARKDHGVFRMERVMPGEGK